MKEIKGDAEEREAYQLLEEIKSLFEEEAKLKKDIKTQQFQLDKALLQKYHKLTETEVRTLVIEDKWLAKIQDDIQSDIDGISQRLTARIKELAERYESTLGSLNNDVSDFEKKVEGHLQKMGLVWS